MSAFKTPAEVKRFAKRLTLFDLVALFDELGMQVQLGVVQRPRPAPEQKRKAKP